MHKMGSTTPLLNDYKKEFFWKRFPQTVLGGPKLKLGFCAPACVYLSQTVIFFLPLIYGATMTVLVEINVLSYDLAVYIAGGLMVLSVIIIQIIARITAWKRTLQVSPSDLHDKMNVLSDEDDINFDSCCGVETIGFILSSKKYIVNIVFHAVLSGPLVGIATWYLLPQTLMSLFDNLAVTVVLFIFGWLTVCVTQYSFSIGAPPETAVYRAADTYELYSLTRPLYVLFCLSIHIMDQHLSYLHLTNEVLHILFALFPIFWTFGLLPPIDALLLWIMEQAHVFLFGGSPMASNLRLLLMSLMSVIAFLVIHFIPFDFLIVELMAVLGYLLSLNLGELGAQIVRRCKKNEEIIRQEHTNSGFLWHWTWQEAVFHFFMISIVGGLVAGISYANTHYGSSADNAKFYLGHCITGFLLLEVILVDIQKVYVFHGLMRSCIFPVSVMNLVAFKSRKKRLIIIGHVRRAIINFIAPLLMLSYLSMSFDFSTDDGSVEMAFNKLGAFRAFRWIWQNSPCSMLEISVAHIIIVTVPEVTQGMNLGIQLLILSIARNRAALILDKLYFWFTLTITFWSDPKQRRKSSVPLIAFNFILFPLVFAIICMAALLAAPLLPLFTLPLFLIGYPRPLRFWPGTPGVSQNTCTDTVYYQQGAPEIAKAFQDGFTAGSVGEVGPGQHYLVRFQDRLIWVQVLEKGFGFCTLSIKGMELQETSCHTVEATAVDDILEETFESTGHKCCVANKYPLHTLCPCDVRFIKTYSDAKNQLTGVLDSPDTVQMIESSFTKTLVWVLLHHMKNKNKNLSVNDKMKITEPQRTAAVSASSEITRSPSALSDYESSAKNCPERPQSRGAESINSFVNSIWSDDEDSLLNESCDKKKKVNFTLPDNTSLASSIHPLKLPPVNNKPFTSPVKSSSAPVSKLNDVDSLFKTLDLGLPATDVMVSSVQNGENERKYEFSSAHSRRLSIPEKWMKIPLDDHRLSQHVEKFSLDWFKHVLFQLELQSATESDSVTIAKELCADKCLVDMYRKIITATYMVIYDLGLSGSVSGPSHVYKIYHGDVPWSVASEWITEDQEFFRLILKAFRYAVKLSIDQVLLGEANDHAEVQEYLEEYDNEWYIGAEKDREWNESIMKGKPQLFSLAYNTDKSVYTSRVLSIQDTPVYISSLNPEAVHAQWANLNLELLYMTNDDEERYSIQAHRTLLRNLHVQAADPPLGYPIYASEPVSVPCL